MATAKNAKRSSAPHPSRHRGEIRRWLLKSEPNVFSIEDLERDGRTSWEGVRNYQARNFLREMQVGDLALFYHSNADPSGVAGVCEVVRTAHPDPTQFDPASRYYDPSSRPEEPRWEMVEVAFVERFPRVVSLEAMKNEAALEGMIVLRKGTRLSVTPVSEAHFNHVVRMGRG